MNASAFRVPVLLVALGFTGLCAAQRIPATASDAFQRLDTNQDGLVSEWEYNSDAAFRAMDSNRNNRISPEELQELLGPQEDGMASAEDRIRRADRNQDGELSDEELRRVAEMRFNWLDGDGDGNLELSELRSGFGIPTPQYPLPDRP